jgi:hypothetical protein
MTQGPPAEVPAAGEAGKGGGEKGRRRRASGTGRGASGHHQLRLPHLPPSGPGCPPAQAAARLAPPSARCPRGRRRFLHVGRRSRRLRLRRRRRRRQSRRQRLHRICEEGCVRVDAQLIHVAGAQALLPEALLLHLFVSDEEQHKKQRASAESCGEQCTPFKQTLAKTCKNVLKAQYKKLPMAS